MPGRFVRMALLAAGMLVLLSQSETIGPVLRFTLTCLQVHCIGIGLFVGFVAPPLVLWMILALLEAALNAARENPLLVTTAISALGMYRYRKKIWG